MKHTFAELLRVFVALHQAGDDTLSQGDLAQAIGVTKVTINNWMKGRYAPRDPEMIARLAAELKLSQFEYDVLVYTLNPDWVKYHTPYEVLEQYDIRRFREHYMPIVIPDDEPPLIEDIEQDWVIAFKDTFESNANHWGLGWRDDGSARLERAISNSCYTLRLHSRFHSQVMLGGDSSCYAPPIYYASFEARRISRGNEDEDGYAFVFEEINDNAHTIFRVRDGKRLYSVFRCEACGDVFKIFVDRTFHPTINHCPQTNKLAIFANHDQHWFYINNVLVASATIPRIPHSRLDIGIISFGEETVVCEYRNFIVRVPPDQAFENGTPTYQ